MSIENTSKRDPLLHLAGSMGSQENASRYILEMESAGQAQLVASELLPKSADWDDLEKLGVVRGDDVDGDGLFVHATIPAGWQKVASDEHDMYSYLVDANGIRRVSVFYKAAFYDRKASMSVMNVGADAATHAIYGNDSPALPDKWEHFSADERARYIGSLRAQIAEADEIPSVYGKYRRRVNELLSLALQA